VTNTFVETLLTKQRPQGVRSAPRSPHLSRQQVRLPRPHRLMWARRHLLHLPTPH